MNETKPKRLLAVNLNYLGDALFTTPALAALRERFPEVTVDVLAGERAAAILGDNPGIDRLLTRPPRGGAARAMNLAQTLREGRYDAVVLFQSTLANAALAWTARVPVRVGFNQDGCGPFLTHGVAERRVGEHVVDAYTRLARAFDDRSGEPVTPGAHRLSIAVSPADEAFADDFLHNRELAPPIVGLVIGATRPQKRWPEEYFARLADKLWGAAGVCSVLLGGPEEEEAAERIRAQSHSPLVSAVGLTTAKQLAALVARLGVVVSGDSGPLHIATAMDTPVVALFGSTDPAETGPWKPSGGKGATAIVLYDGLPCAPCRKSPTCDGRFDCLRALTPERVFEAACEQLQLPPRRAALPVIVAASGKGGEI
jgi:lipopolysaccharide heptosyltransferase II